MHSLPHIHLLLAHGLQITTNDVPLPLSVFYIGAVVILVASFVLLGAAWKQPRWDLRDAGEDRLARGRVAPRWINAISRCRVTRTVVALIFLVTILIAVISEFVITADAGGARLLPILLFATWWLGLVPLSLLLGGVWRRCNPVRLLARLGGLGDEGVRSYPSALGVWPALVGLVAFAWIELVLHPTDFAAAPILGVIIIVYLALTIVAMAWLGAGSWLTNGGDVFTTYTDLLAAMSPWSRGADGRLRWHAPLVGALDVAWRPGLAALITTMVGTVSYDGLSNTGWWRSRVDTAVANLAGDGWSVDVSRLLFGTFGLALMIIIVWGAFELAAAAAGRIGQMSRTTNRRAAAAFAPTLLPIALAYVVAHYFAFFMAHFALLRTVISHPFSASLVASNDPVVSSTVVWWVQVGSIVIGHVVSLLLAHDRALALASSRQRAAVSQLPLLALMVLYTVGGLYFLSDGLS